MVQFKLTNSRAVIYFMIRSNQNWTFFEYIHWKSCVFNWGCFFLRYITCFCNSGNFSGKNNDSGNLSNSKYSGSTR